MEIADDKSNRVDLLCENQKHELLIIELQYHSELDYFQRMLFGTSKLIMEYIKLGQPYSSVLKVYSINIVYFDLGQGQDYIYHGRIDFQAKHKGGALLLSKGQQLRFGKKQVWELYPEYIILKINNFNKVAKSPLDEWIYYLKTSSLPRNFTAKGLAEVEQQLKLDNMSPELLAKYMKAAEGLNITASMIETAFDEGELTGLEKGIEKGIEKGKTVILEQTVVNAFKNEYAIQSIAAIVGLSEKQVITILIRKGLLEP